MSYEKINFKNREVEKPLTFKKHQNDDGTITLEPKPGTIVEPGTPLLADHFNHMDDGIYRAHKEIDNLKLSGIERNKELVANLNSKKVSATTNDSLKTNIAKVKDIKLGSGNAVTGDVLEGKTFSSSQGTDLTGTMPNHSKLNKIITTQNGKQIITPGYYEGGEIQAQFANLVPENIKQGVNVGGVVGALDTLKYSSGTIPDFRSKSRNGGSELEGSISLDFKPDIVKIYYTVKYITGPETTTTRRTNTIGLFLGRFGVEEDSSYEGGYTRAITARVNDKGFDYYAPGYCWGAGKCNSADYYDITYEAYGFPSK